MMMMMMMMTMTMTMTMSASKRNGLYIVWDLYMYTRHLFAVGEATAPWRPGSGRDAKTLGPGARAWKLEKGRCFQQQNMGLPSGELT